MDVASELEAVRQERDSLAAELAALRGQLSESASDLERSQRLLHYIAEHAPAIIYVKDLEGRFVLSNRLHAEILERTPAEVVGCLESDFLSEEEAAEITAASEQVLATGQLASEEFCIRLADGEHWFLEQIFPLLDGDGRAFALAGISTDVTRRRRAEEEVAIFRALVEHSPDSVLLAAYPVDWQRPWVHANPMAVKLMTEVSSLSSCLKEHVEALGAEHFDEVLASGGVWHRELTIEDPKATHGLGRVLHASAFAIASEPMGEAGALAWILRDVTEEHRLVLERERLQEEIIAAQEETLMELSVPMMPLSQGVIAVPLIGRYNRKRGQRLVEVLTRGMVVHRARTVILDLTGVRDVEAESAALIQRISQMVRLLGARLILTGIPAPVAALLAGTDLDLRTVTIERNLGSGIALALRR